MRTGPSSWRLTIADIGARRPYAALTVALLTACSPAPAPETADGPEPKVGAPAPPATKAKPDLRGLCGEAQARLYEIVRDMPSENMKPGAKEAILSDERSREGETIAACVTRDSVDAAECQTIAPHIVAFRACEKLAGPRPEPRATREECRAVNRKLAAVAGKPPPEGDTMMLFVFTCLMTLSSDDIACALRAENMEELEVCDEATKRR